MDTVVEVVGGILMLLITVVGWLLNRTITQFDTSVKELTSDVNALKIAMPGFQQLIQFQQNEIVSLKHELASHRRSFAEMDKIIYSRLGVNVPAPEEG